MNQLEQFREQCVQACEDLNERWEDGETVRPSDCADAIRALPLPEVAQEPIGYFRGDKQGNLFWTEDCVCADPVYPCASDDVDDHGEPTVSIPIYTLPPDAEVLRKDNKIYLEENLSMKGDIDALRKETDRLREDNEQLREEIAALKSGINARVQNARSAGATKGYKDTFSLLSEENRRKLSSDLAHGARIVFVGVAREEVLQNYLSGKEIHIAVTYAATKEVAEKALKGGAA